MQALLDAIAQTTPGTDAARLFHGRGGLHPGCEHWLLDWFAPVWVLTCFQPASALSAQDTAALHAALASRWQQLAPGEPLNAVLQCRHEGRSDNRVLAGSVPDPHVVTEGGARWRVQVLKGQNHGLFLDMAEGRRWVRTRVAELATLSAQGSGSTWRARPKLLNLFAYTCAFSVVALQAGAGQVVNLDMSDGALATGKHNHHLNGVASGASFLPHDLFSSWGKLTRGGPYDLVVVDPPSYQKGSFVASKDYARVVRRLPDLLLPGGQALLCLNAPELGHEFLHELVREHAPMLQFEQRLPNPPAFADVSDQRSLKVLVYRAPD